MFRLHYWFDEKLGLCSTVASILLKIRFGHTQINVHKIGLPMSRIVCINPCHVKVKKNHKLWFLVQLSCLHVSEAFFFFFCFIFIFILFYAIFKSIDPQIFDLNALLWFASKARRIWNQIFGNELHFCHDHQKYFKSSLSLGVMSRSFLIIMSEWTKNVMEVSN